MRYILDTNALIQNPEILASAASRELLIPKAVFAQLLQFGRPDVKSVLGTLLNQALAAGVEVVSPPDKLRQEPNASDRAAQRLDSTDMEIARTAIAYQDQGPVAVVTLDRVLQAFLSSRGVQSFTPQEFLSQAPREQRNALLIDSADSLKKQQWKNGLVSVAVGIVASIGGNLLYSHASFLVNTVTIWGTLAALPLLGLLLFWYRHRYRLSYGIFEFLAGVMMSYYVFFPTFSYAGIGILQGIQILGGLYVMVRGLDNVSKGLEGTRFDSTWKRLFP